MTQSPQKDLKSISTDISLECWKKLKMLAISREVSLQVFAREILEKAMEKKNPRAELPDV